MQNEFPPQPPMPEPPLLASQPDAHPNDWLLGIGILILLHLVQIPLAGMTLGMSLIAIGLSQLAYVIPAILIAKKKQRPGIVKGLIIGAALTFLLNGACTIYFFSNTTNFH